MPCRAGNIGWLEVLDENVHRNNLALPRTIISTTRVSNFELGSTVSRRAESAAVSSLAYESSDSERACRDGQLEAQALSLGLAAAKAELELATKAGT